MPESPAQPPRVGGILGTLRVLRCRVVRGPNRWSRLPIVHLRVDLGELERHPSDRIPGFTDRLVGTLPGLGRHTCSYGRPGGFIRRLEEGTWMGHVTEHVALELQRVSGGRATRGKTRSAGPPGEYDIVFAYDDERVGLAAGRAAVTIVNDLIERDRPAAGDADAVVAELRSLAERGRLGMSTQTIVDQARRRHIPWTRLNDRNLVQLGWGIHARRIRATVTSETSLIGAEIARDKDESCSLLARAGVPVPAWRLVRTVEEATDEAQRLGYPVVLKPVDGNHGRGVVLDVGDDQAVEAAFERAASASRRGLAIVQRQLAGRDYRLLVIDGRMVACAERIPAGVEGDGRSTVKELIDRENEGPRRGVGHARELTRIRLDEAARTVLEAQGWTIDAVPAEGRWIALARGANLSTGGTSTDRTDEVHPDVASMAELAARVVGLDVVGIDLVTPDICRPLRETGGAIIELNAGPGFRMHTHPTVGRARDVGAAVIDRLFGPGGDGRIPIAAVTGSNGKTTTVRLLAHLLSTAGRHTGFTTTEDIVADGLTLKTGDMAGPASARLLLSTPTIEAAVLEVARGGILRDGLGYDYNDVAIVTNVTGDHLGLDGIRTLDELAAVKAVIVEAVPRSGTAVLNADDPLVLGMASRCRGAVALTTSIEDPDLPARLAVERHATAGGLAGYTQAHDGVEHIVVVRGGSTLVRIPVRDVPITWGGAARMHVSNAVAAACAAVALEVGSVDIELGLRSFVSSPGRVERHV
ncbi:MAG: cyanophycin synthetase, partial [Chloroflexi bacterium]|nr:cyanophycin synthetase [Chloroflexota bacterium]